MTDQLHRAVRGDRAALRQIVGHWMPAMRRWALITCGDPVLAEDAVQESLVRLLRFIGRYDPKRPFGPWLKTLVQNACRNELARSDRREAPTSGHEMAPPASPDRPLDLHRAAQRVRAAFALLSPRQREILDLVDLQGHTPAEVAEALGLSQGAVRGQLFQARRALRAGLVDDILPLLREA